MPYKDPIKQKEYQKKYGKEYEKIPKVRERRREREKDYKKRPDVIEKDRKYAREYYWKNKDKVINYHKKNKEHIKEINRKWCIKNEDRIKKQKEEYRKKLKVLGIKYDKKVKPCIDCGKLIQKNSLRCYSCSQKGDRCNFWKGGISPNLYGIEFNNELKKQIRKRDEYRCQQCFRHQDELFTKKGKKRKLDIHHIDFNKQNNNSSNLISLCHNCHIQTNFNREDWTKYFQKKVGGEFFDH